MRSSQARTLNIALEVVDSVQTLLEAGTKGGQDLVARVVNSEKKLARIIALNPDRLTMDNLLHRLASSEQHLRTAKGELDKFRYVQDPYWLHHNKLMRLPPGTPPPPKPFFPTLPQSERLIPLGATGPTLSAEPPTFTPMEDDGHPMPKRPRVRTPYG